MVWLHICHEEGIGRIHERSENQKLISMWGAYIIGILIALVGTYVSSRLRSKFDEYSKIQLANGMSGKEIALKMLHDNGIYDVQVVSVQGKLTDHYNPVNKTVNLSPDVYEGRSVSAAAVAAHECGHAVQHQVAYSWLTMRSKLVPVVSFTSNIVQWVLLGGILLINRFPGLLLAGIIMLAAVTLFSLITLPVEYDASHRALAWIRGKGIARNNEYDAAQDALKWAARTYVVSAVGSVATLLYYLMIYMGRRR